MMGPKKLDTIRKEIRTALTKTGRDPIQWLNERIRALSRAGKSTDTSVEVLQSLRRLLQTPSKPKRRSPRARLKK
jgi:hypothetical protein